jgi:C1A family cysteine protease
MHTETIKLTVVVSRGVAVFARGRQRTTAVSSGLGVLLVVALSLVASVHAQTLPDPQDQVYGLGAVAPTPEQVAAFPRAPELRALVPPRFDIGVLFPPIAQQGKQGSCVAWSAGYALRSYYLSKMDRLDISKPQNVPSPAYIYNHANWYRSQSGCMDAGMIVFNALDILKAGVVSLADMPYDDIRCSPGPDVAMQTRATKFRINAWQYVDPNSLEQIKAQIADGQPVVFGIDVAQSFQKHRGSGVYSRNPREQTIGGHAMVLVGYDDDRRAFRLLNSWGKGWGEEGRAWMAYDTFMRDARDSYIIYPASAR